MVALLGKSQEEKVQISLAVDISKILEDAQLISRGSFGGFGDIVKYLDADRGDCSAADLRLGDCQQCFDSHTKVLEERGEEPAVSFAACDSKGTFLDICIRIGPTVRAEKLGAWCNVVHMILNVGRDVISDFLLAIVSYKLRVSYLSQATVVFPVSECSYS